MILVCYILYFNTSIESATEVHDFTVEAAVQRTFQETVKSVSVVDSHICHWFTYSSSWTHHKHPEKCVLQLLFS